MRTQLTLLLIFLPCLVMAQRVSFGVGYSQALALESGGVNLRAYYLASERFCFGPELGIFPKVQTRADDDRYFRQLTELNLNGHYIFELTHHLATYPLAGINYSIEVIGEPDHRETEYLPGLNAGAGFHYIKGKIGLLAEYKYVWLDNPHGVGVQTEQILTAGVFLMLGRQKETEHNE